MEKGDFKFNTFKTLTILMVGILIALLWNSARLEYSHLNYKNTLGALVLGDVNAGKIENITENISANSNSKLSILFLGDIMLDRGIRAQISKTGEDNVFVSSTKKLSETYDLTIANLEGPITTYSSKTIDASGRGIPGFSFTFPTSSATALKKSGIDIVSLANNHTENFGYEGLNQTVKWLKQAEVQYFGNPTNSPESESPVSPLSKIICEQKICITLIDYHEFAYKNENYILDEIKKAKDNKADFIIVFPHWGVEYDNYPSTKQKALAHTWVDAGANLIVGAHPHVIQSEEAYKDVKIYYSLGNYLFDQYFSYDTTHGLALGIHLEKDSTTNFTKIKDVDLIPINNTKSITRPANATDTKIILDKFAEISK